MKNRKLVKQSPVRSSYLAYSHRFQRACALESTIERDYFNLLHFENTSSNVQTQPFSIYYHHNQKRLRYTPDFLVDQYIDEVKLFKKTLTKDFIKKKCRLEQVFAKQVRVFRVITERDLRIGQRAQNLRYLQPALSRSAPTDEMKRLIQLYPTGNVRLDELQAELTSLAFDPSFIRRAIAHKLIGCDLTQCWATLQLSW